MAKVGTIAIDLVAYTGKLLAPLKSAEKGVASLASKASSVGGTFMKFAAPLTGLVGGFLTTSYAIGKVTEAFADMDNIGKEADRLGIATEELVGLQHAANMAGVSAEQLGGSMQKFLKGGGSMSELGEVADQMADTTKSSGDIMDEAAATSTPASLDGGRGFDQDAFVQEWGAASDANPAPDTITQEDFQRFPDLESTAY
jgi:hypothetical protein